MGIEVELKLAVLPVGVDLDPAALFALAARHFRIVTPPRTIPIDNRYFRDAKGRLQGRSAVLRARREGLEHRGTIKAPGTLRSGVRRRIEVEVPLDSAPSSGDPLPPELANGLANLDVHLDHWPAEHFRTRFERSRSVLDLGGGLEVELAHDRGVIEADGASAPLHELELELLRGDGPDASAALCRAARRLAATLPLRPAALSKGERGLLLAGELEPRDPLGAEASPAARFEADLVELERRGEADEEEVVRGLWERFAAF